MIRLIVIAFTLMMFSYCAQKKKVDFENKEEGISIKINGEGDILYNKEKINLQTLETGLKEITTNQTIDTLSIHVHETATLGSVIEVKQLIEKYNIVALLKKYEALEKLEIVITKAGHLYWKFKRISENNLKDVLLKTLKTRKSNNQNVTVTITADEGTNINNVIKVMNLIRESGGQAILATKNK